MAKHSEAIELIDGGIWLLKKELDQDAARIDVERRAEINRRIATLEKSKAKLVWDDGAPAVPESPETFRKAKE